MNRIKRRWRLIGWASLAILAFLLILTLWNVAEGLLH